MYFWNWKTKILAIYIIITHIIIAIGELSFSIIGFPFANFHFPKWLEIEMLIKYMSLILLCIVGIIIFLRITKLNDDGEFELTIPTEYDDMSRETFETLGVVLICNPFSLTYLIVNGFILSVVYIDEYFRLHEIPDDTKIPCWTLSALYTIVFITSLSSWIYVTCEEFCETRDNEDNDEALLI